ncbi:serine/threonine dehydratase [Leptolyngbya boryana NIES-2135]|jgi:threonine dehydratase|uniref:threonine ammonia-lyase n=1 Tax=Leptolyngbya boryana NIES-2135 TaxID=1973484 RepID=A0A1Z4JAW9_LEPBY|nr:MULTISPECIES: threo-3-hydroxy-L-aspartate ammonia-lyase [Leptolyngbya]BAY53853.1 serine/threonine dehydratase [Leptolyngbya boryana NIES-2135]MBD2371546.1 threo-3-hydroxy-L-aspartate ammonia-lyase [Leptolyngbya sp. FACHB-161]MBD2378096.1 threo-3-hydroxy-L-aspartate ammonia-lyase [Leptolyngbya sp. FACHB-238]MBD2402504.1 threo-3-hydroxy-L-aspartate ammonia-lyase [Leptolyngbya sp. FACHB-239]MBD2408998.1 threo-3-hydroxy-L-aspartate ammonia-lyase [Leptolyngbya sp. FACHB-402]
MVAYSDILAAADRLAGIAHKTPVITSRLVNHRTGAQVFFKCENFQRSGSFKFRGAYNAMAQLSDEQKQRGVLAYSSGNHGQALALAGELLDIPVTIVMPSDAPVVKKAATESYGAEVITYNRALQKREDVAQSILSDRILIPPFDYEPVIAGQGTAAKELIEEVGELDVLLVCCGGGGLLSGCAIATKHLAPNCQIIGVEPRQADDAKRSFYSRTLQTVENPNTIADGARTPALGQLTFPIILERVDEMVTVSEAAILRTMFFLWERLKIVVEPTGVLAAAALLEGIVSFPDAKIGVIISGGNIDLKEAGKLFTKANAREKATRRRPLAPEMS